jgi:hypothetical protein
MAKHKNWDADDDSGDNSGDGRHREPQKCTFCDDGLVRIERDGERVGPKGVGTGTDYERCKMCGGTGTL